MSEQEWWAAERKAAEFWRKVKENQTAWHERLDHWRSAAPAAPNRELDTPMRRQPLGL